MDDPHRIGPVRQLGIDETSFLAANGILATAQAARPVELVRVKEILPKGAATPEQPR